MYVSKTTQENIIEAIQSRCAILRFTRLSDTDLLKRILTVAQAEGVDCDDKGVEALIFTAEGATARLPLWKLLCDARPQCQSCRKMRLPCSCTALVVSFQPSTISSVNTPGDSFHPFACSEIVVASVISRPALLRWR